MADEKQVPAPTGAAPVPPAAAPAAAPSKPAASWMLPVVLAGALVAGAGVGGLLVGPRIVAGRAAPGAAAPAAAGERGATDHAPVFKLDNVIVNPAGSQGLHFLMASVALEVPSMKIESDLKAHEAELRDLTISILSRQSMESLQRPEARDQIKQELLEAFAPFAGGKRGVKLFLPQFVIQ